MKKRKKTPIIFLCNPQEQTFTLKHTILSLVMSHVTRISYVICHMSILPYVTFMCLYVIRMSLICTRLSSVCHSHVIRMSLICTRMSFVCHSYVLVCHPHITLMSSVCHSYVLVCTLMSLICTLCHPYVTRMWFYHEPNLIVFLQKICS